MAFVSMHLIDIHEDQTTRQLNLILNNDAVNYLDQVPEDYEIVPVAIVGTGRSGKSSLLNRLIGRDVFQTGSSTERVTKGIWIFIDLKHNTKKAIMYLDVEGFGDSTRTNSAEYDQKLLAIIWQMCDIVMYNTKELYGTDMTDRIIFFSTLFARYRKQSNVLSKPIFAFLCRDFSLDMPPDPDAELAMLLRASPNGFIAFEAFRELKSFLLVKPKEGILKDLHQIPETDLDRNFVTAQNRLRELIEEQAKPIRVHSVVHVSGKVLKEVIKQTVKAVKDDDLHDIFKTLPEILKEKNDATRKRVYNTYMVTLERKWPGTTDEETLSLVEEECMFNATSEVQKEGFIVPGIVEFNLQEFKAQLRGSFQVLSENRSSEQLNGLKTELEEKYRRGDYVKLGGASEFERDIQNLKQEYMQKRNLGPRATYVWDTYDLSIFIKLNGVRRSEEIILEERERQRQQRLDRIMSGVQTVVAVGGVATVTAVSVLSHSTLVAAGGMAAAVLISRHLVPTVRRALFPRR